MPEPEESAEELLATDSLFERMPDPDADRSSGRIMAPSEPPRVRAENFTPEPDFLCEACGGEVGGETASVALAVPPIHIPREPRELRSLERARGDFRLPLPVRGLEARPLPVRRLLAESVECVSSRIECTLVASREDRFEPGPSVYLPSSSLLCL